MDFKKLAQIAQLENSKFKIRFFLSFHRRTDSYDPRRLNLQVRRALKAQAHYRRGRLSPHRVRLERLRLRLEGPSGRARESTSSATPPLQIDLDRITPSRHTQSEEEVHHGRDHVDAEEGLDGVAAAHLPAGVGLAATFAASNALGADGAVDPSAPSGVC